jgi:DNA-directed RNA polymerase specialized sigma24 family protein
MEIEQIMEKLTPRQQQIIKLRAEGYSYKDIGKELGMKEQSIKNEIQRIRKRMSTFASKKSYIDSREMFEENLKTIEIDIVKRAKNTFAMYPELEKRGITWEDLAQELRIHLMNKFDTFNPEKSAFRTWAFRVMANKIKDILKHPSYDILDQEDTISLDELKEKGLEADTYTKETREENYW